MVVSVFGWVLGVFGGSFVCYLFTKCLSAKVTISFRKNDHFFDGQNLSVKKNLFFDCRVVFNHPGPAFITLSLITDDRPDYDLNYMSCSISMTCIFDNGDRERRDATEDEYIKWELASIRSFLTEYSWLRYTLNTTDNFLSAEMNFFPQKNLMRMKIVWFTNRSY
jgi:hypothetical protein